MKLELNQYEENKLRTVINNIGYNKYPRNCPQLKGSYELTIFMEGVNHVIEYLKYGNLKNEKFTDYVEERFKEDNEN